MKPTIIAFVDFQIQNSNHWDMPEDENWTNDLEWFKAKKDDAEVHVVDIEGNPRQLFFSKGGYMRIVGNTVWFNASYTDYLITDHSKKFPSKKRIDE